MLTEDALLLALEISMLSNHRYMEFDSLYTHLLVKIVLVFAIGSLRNNDGDTLDNVC